MNNHQQLEEWRRLSRYDDCVTGERFCAEDIRAMVDRIGHAETVLAAIADANARGSLVTVVARLTAIIDMARAVVRREQGRSE